MGVVQGTHTTVVRLSSEFGGNYAGRKNNFYKLVLVILAQFAIIYRMQDAKVEARIRRKFRLVAVELDEPRRRQ